MSLNSKTSGHTDILIIGGGLAGLVSGIDLARAGYSVRLVEKKEYPRHKVCGEYISNEIRPYLEKLEIFPHEHHPQKINRLQISGPSGRIAESEMTMGGFGLSRYTFDEFLYRKALQNGVIIHTNSEVTGMVFKDDSFKVSLRAGEEFQAKVVIGAHGKRSLVDKALNRNFIKRKTTYVGIKHHFKSDFRDGLVALHNFPGGYCGLSKVEGGRVNLCYLTTTAVFRQYHGIAEMEENHLCTNPHLKSFFRTAQPLFEKPLSISQINFDPKPIIENHVLMCGDAAGMIHPLCGNGMAMAIQGSQIAAEAIKNYFESHRDRSTLEKQYATVWRYNFQTRLKFGRGISRLFGNPQYSEWGVELMRWSPFMLRQAVKMSHGKALN